MLGAVPGPSLPTPETRRAGMARTRSGPYPRRGGARRSGSRPLLAEAGFAPDAILRRPGSAPCRRPRSSAGTLGRDVWIDERLGGLVALKELTSILRRCRPARAAGPRGSRPGLQRPRVAAGRWPGSRCERVPSPGSTSRAGPTEGARPAALADPAGPATTASFRALPSGGEAARLSPAASGNAARSAAGTKSPGTSVAGDGTEPADGLRRSRYQIQDPRRSEVTTPASRRTRR